MENIENQEPAQAVAVETVASPAVPAAEPVVAAPVAPQPAAPYTAPAQVNAPVGGRGEPINKARLQQAAQVVAPPPPPIYPDRADGAKPINLKNFIEIPAPGQPQTAPAADPIQTPAPPAQAAQPAAPVAQPDPTQPTAQAAAQPTPDNAWETLTNGQIKTSADWETFRAEQARLAEEVNRLNTTRVEPSNPLVAKINDVFKNGGTIADAAALVAAQNLDPATMAPITAIKAAIAYQHPELDTEEVEAHLSRLGIDLQDPEGPSTRAAIKTEAKKATDYLNSLKVQMDNPAVLKQAQDQATAQAANLEAWKSAPPLQPTVKIAEKVGETIIAADFQFSQQAIAYAEQVGEGMKGLPYSPENVNNYLHLKRTLAIAHDIERYTQHIAAETHKAATLDAMKKTAGPTPSPVPHVDPPEQARVVQRIPLSGR